ncbi:hypothetical protein [Cupriavidus oxalaticus]|uniref:P27 family phage terminase small subunit n=1 Tax=Cupriavidus oxalaticus TaxID=96344 RepID=A0A4P7L9M4_9BURK|nr:hypothetical protein [Cupriavidus oxalaticus]QBY52524.1 hypothetical protein E0W60_15145 [Cupriavidus oxalaticus]QEZ46002.1 hypothetical protein D2917_17035 [Cupriavidus oxalaticus]
MKMAYARNIALAAQREAWAPPPGMPKAAAQVWNDTVSAVTGDHFAQGDEIVLMMFCEATVRLRRVARALERLPLVTTDPERLRLRRSLVGEANALRGQVLNLARALRLAPVSRRMQDKARTDLPTRDRRSKRLPGDDLFAC